MSPKLLAEKYLSGRSVSPSVLESGAVMAIALAESLDKPFPWVVRSALGTWNLAWNFGLQ